MGFVLLSYISIIGIFLLVTYLVWIRKHRLIKYVCITAILFAIFVYIYRSYTPPIPQDTGIVVESKTVKSGYRYTVKSGFFNYHMFTTSELEIGHKIRVKGTYQTYEKDQFKGDFSSADYHKTRFVYYVIFEPTIEVIGHQFVPHIWFHQVKTWVNQLPKYSQVFVNSLVLGVFETDYKEEISKVGITHLFVLSGLHVTVLIGFMDKALFFLPKRFKRIVQTIGLLFYLLVTLWPVSLLRAVTQYVLYEWLNFDKIRYTRLDAFSFTWIILVMVNPFFFTHMGFQLTFLVSFLFIIGNFKTDLKGTLMSTFTAQTLVQPITSKITQMVYPISWVLTPLMIPLFNYVLMPLAWLSLWRPIGVALDIFFKGIIDLILMFEFNAIGFKIPIITGGYALIYWILWIRAYVCEAYDRKLIHGLFIVLFVLIMPWMNLLNPIGKVVFLSVGQGDTTIIQRPYQSCTVVIDAFGDVSNYLKQEQITTIDYLIITHGDYDHHKETNTLLQEFRVKNLVLSAYDTSAFRHSMAIHHPQYVKAGDELVCGDIILSIVSPIRSYANDNDQSIVIQTTVHELTYLFTGDIEYDAEKDMVNNLNYDLKSDVLKVGHHGSISSSHIGFLNAVKPEYAIISSSLYNRFGHPHEEVLNRLNDLGVKTYQTNIHETITFVDLPFYPRYVILLHKSG